MLDNIAEDLICSGELDDVETVGGMTDEQLRAFLEALALLVEQDPENAVKNIRQIQSELTK